MVVSLTNCLLDLLNLEWFWLLARSFRAKLLVVLFVKDGAGVVEWSKEEFLLLCFKYLNVLANVLNVECMVSD